eukprot:12335966-Karenia_brevis.AAC.1
MQAARAEGAAVMHRSYGLSLLDLVKAFEKIPHHHVVRAARKHGYCLWTLRLSLDAYRAQRTLVVDGCCSRLVRAPCGITAGSGFATEELCCLLLDVCDDTYEVFPYIRVSLYVDDLTLEAEGSARFVTSALAR